MNRKHYLDNVRTIAVLMLFPFHVFVIYNNWGESWYVHSVDLLIPSLINQINWLWMMPTLFVVAGISSRYALEKRSAGEYAKERTSKLLLPLVFGILLIIPIQSYIAGLFFFGRADYFYFFTRLTDFSGYDGAFTPGHLWFILYLFVISMASLPLMIFCKKKSKGGFGGNVPLIWVILMGILPCLGNEIFDVGGKSPTEYLAFFLLGYFFLSNENVLEKLEKYRFLLLGLFLLGAVLTARFDHLLIEMASWLSVLTVLGMARRHLDFSGKISKYLSKASFGVYLFHQSWIVVTGFFIIKLIDNPIVQIPLILTSSIILTYLTYEISQRAPALRWMFGLTK